ncbi:MAG: hypothetical protein ACOZQL_22645 [Myxococcota bacterium]
MATSKSKKPAPKKPAAPAKKAAPKKPAADVGLGSTAVRTLSKLPALNAKLRAAYRAAFSDEQCDAWGEKTKADNVIKEAERWIATLARELPENADVAYSRRRLAYLCELVVLLADEMARTSGGAALKATRSAALELANNARIDLARRLRTLAGGQQKLLSEIAAASPDNRDSGFDVQESLTELLSIANRVRRDDVMEALADDLGLTESRLNAAYAALENLAGAREVADNAAAYEGDAPTVNRIEGRVLREMKLAQRVLREARERGIKVPSLVAASSLSALFSTKDDETTAPAPAPN